jgi:hypothetical protein
MSPWKLLGRLLLLPGAAFLLTSLPPGIERGDWVLQMHTDDDRQIVLRIFDDPHACEDMRRGLGRSKYVTYSCGANCLEREDGSAWCRRDL